MTTTVELTTVDSALMYAAQGVHVFPLNATVKGNDGSIRCACSKGFDCTAPGKHPLETGYLDKAATDELTIKKWFRMHPDRGVGASLTGFLLVETDPRNGLNDLVDWVQRYGALPSTLVSRSGRNDGGCHFLYRLPEGCTVRTTQAYPVINGRTLRGVELKANAGTVVLPPSMHKAGNPYTWLNDRGPDVQEITTAPEWLITAVQNAVDANRNTRREKEARVINAALEIINNDEFLDAETFADRVADHTGGKVTGVGSGYQTNCPAHPDDNPSLTVGTGDDGQTLLHCKTGCGFEKVLNAVNVKSSQLFPTKEVTVQGREDAVKGSERTIPAFGTGDVLMSTTWPEPEWTVHRFCPAGSLMCLYGMEGVGKTWSVLDLISGVVTGTHWAGQRVAQGKVLLISYELTKARLQDRIRRLLQARFKTGYDAALRAVMDNLFYVCSDDFTDAELIQMPQHAEIIATRVKALDIKLVIFDTLRRTHGGNENDNQEMNGVLSAFDRIRNHTGATVLYVHHVARGSSKPQGSSVKPRGSSVMEGNTSAMVHLTKDGKQLTVSCAKANHGEEFLPVKYTIHKDGVITLGEEIGVSNGDNQTTSEVQVEQNMLRVLGDQRLTTTEWKNVAGEGCGSGSDRIAAIKRLAQKSRILQEMVGRSTFNTAVREKATPMMFIEGEVSSSLK